MRSARTWPMASSAMSSATPSLDINVRAVRRRSCRRKSTPLACCSLATNLVQPLRRPPVFDDGKTSGDVETCEPAMTSRISGGGSVPQEDLTLIRGHTGAAHCGLGQFPGHFGLLHPTAHRQHAPPQFLHGVVRSNVARYGG